MFTDPISGEKLTYDRTRYRPTQAQRDWVAIRFEDCIDPTCARPVTDTDIDHLDEWARDAGPTNEDNLHPLCDTGNRRKNLSRIHNQRQPDGTVSITTPTGYTVTTEAAPF
ncbi:HNH endonuclease signature motif containing protein [Leifsonia sp. YIM 134122]|uniref:HNH endonuclease signature motif containing protein n=1 Tax=Leifsonia stereocauli TaxID=3134136 RepID=A0ABU9W667_9MICO